MQPSGDWKSYDKRHLFRMADEHEHYADGSERLTVELNGWKICPFICYDLRFPVWSRNLKDNQYDLAIFVANWPSARINAWDTLLKARAIENLSYCIGVNRIGQDGNNVDYNGHSSVIDPKGTSLMECAGREIMETITLSKKSLEDYRKKFPADLDADSFTIH